MWVKFTNCKISTGGGTRRDAVPQRTRNGQNICIRLLGSIAFSYSDQQLKWVLEANRDVHTSKETKVVRNFNSREFLARIHRNRRARLLNKLL